MIAYQLFQALRLFFSVLLLSISGFVLYAVNKLAIYNVRFRRGLPLAYNFVSYGIFTFIYRYYYIVKKLII